MKPRVAILLGDPTGIGPELVAKLLADPATTEQADVILAGDPAIYEKGAATAGVAPVSVKTLPYSGATSEFPVGQLSIEAGEYAIGSLREAVGQFHHGTIDALVYAPLNKQAMKRAGLKHEDELHYFAELLGHNGTVSEVNVLDRLWTSRVTSHVPLSAVAGLLTADKIVAAIELLNTALIRAGVAEPKIAVAALNPHAGEGGLIGTEEITTIRPAVERAHASGIQALGPLPADTLFIAARRGDYQGVVTMYHDQGQIALKLLGFDRGVTVSGGLPVPITTPAHGTAFDIAGKGIADPGAMRQAFRIACRMASVSAQATA